MKMIVDETKNKYKVLRDIPMGTIFAFADEDDVEGDDDLYIKNQEEYMTVLKTGQMVKISECWLTLKVIQYDIKISLIDKY